MKKSILILFLVSLGITSCKKDNTKEQIYYKITIDVSDAVEYKYQINNLPPTPRDKKPNASTSIETYFKSGSTASLKITSITAFKDQLFDVKVTKMSTGEVVAAQKAKYPLTVTWEVK